MKDYIEREAICYQLAKQTTIDGQPRAIKRAARIVADFPAADVRPVVRGEWIADDIADNIFHCSICDGDAPVDCTSGREYKSNFCPNCGADMRGEQDE